MVPSAAPRTPRPKPMMKTGSSTIWVTTGTTQVNVEYPIRPSARMRLEKPVAVMLPTSRMSAYAFASCTTSPVAPSSLTSGSRKMIPSTPRSADRIQYDERLVPVARAARVRSPAPSARDSTEAPPAPTVCATAPTRSSRGAATFTDASATGPTQRETKNALVSAYTPYVATDSVVCTELRSSSRGIGSVTRAAAESGRFIPLERAPQVPLADPRDGHRVEGRLIVGDRLSHLVVRPAQVDLAALPVREHILEDPGERLAPRGDSREAVPPETVAHDRVQLGVDRPDLTPHRPGPLLGPGSADLAEVLARHAGHDEPGRLDELTGRVVMVDVGDRYGRGVTHEPDRRHLP